MVATISVFLIVGLTDEYSRFKITDGTYRQPLSCFSADFSPHTDTLGELGKGGALAPPKSRRPPAFVPRPTQLAAASCVGRGTSGESGWPHNGGAKAPPFQNRSEKSRLAGCGKMRRLDSSPQGCTCIDYRLQTLRRKLAQTVILSPYFRRRTTVVRGCSYARELPGSFAALRMTALQRFSAACQASFQP
jgi:hypothetical protein